MGIKAHEEVQDEIGVSIENNASHLKLLQQAASTCTEMYLIIADWEEDAEYIAQMECGFFASYGNVNAEKSKSDVAQGGHQCGKNDFSSRRVVSHTHKEYLPEIDGVMITHSGNKTSAKMQMKNKARKEDGK